MDGNLKKEQKPSAVLEIQNGCLLHCSGGMEEIAVPEGVQEIADWAFGGNPSVRRVILPEGLRKIGRRTFCGCSSLTEIFLPGSVESIGEGAFANCGRLRKIEVPQSNRAYFTVDGALYCQQEGHLVCCPGGKKGVLSIPEGIRVIERNALEGCRFLERITVPSTVVQIEQGSFWNCPSLEEIQVDFRNSFYFSEQGLLYSTTFVLETCPQGKQGTVILPETVRGIAELAFCRCSVTEVGLPGSLTELSAFAFFRCQKLEKVWGADHLPAVRKDTFVGCRKMRDCAAMFPLLHKKTAGVHGNRK